MPIQMLPRLTFTSVPSEQLADLAYALDCCLSASSGMSSERHRQVAQACKLKTQQLLRELRHRQAKEGTTPPLAYAGWMLTRNAEALAGISWDGITADYHSIMCCICALHISNNNKIKRLIRPWLDSADHNSITYFAAACRYYSAIKNITARRKVVREFDQFIAGLDYSQLTETELLRLHSMSALWLERRELKGLEQNTRTDFLRIANALPASSPARLLQLSENLEAENRARCLSLTCSQRQPLKVFVSAQYPDDDSLAAYITALTGKPSYHSREMLIGIADYLQTSIIEKGKAADYIAAITAILNTGMPHFNYPKIAKGLEQTVKQLAKSHAKPRLELAAAYNTLWQQTLKSGYLNHYEQIVRHCYFTLAGKRTYTNLGIDTSDPDSLRTALNFLSANREALWVMSDQYDVDTLLRRYSQTSRHPNY